MILVVCTSTTMFKKTLTLFAGLIHCLLPSLHTLPSNSIVNDVQTIPKGNCQVNCTADYFDEGKDCHDSRGQCNCIAHCCLAFDCRNWGNLVQCRRKCNVVPNKFGKQSHQMNCEQYLCDKAYYDPSWDARGTDDRQRNCVEHCCYAFDCRKASGYCRQTCGVDVWVTHRPG
ncbi:unnamed protein product [Oppiella nova]|uniref:Uncharacterized protein n=1 Tax=Oppiella nova TaxID=334625 RepID=A0A7R9QQM1_9ACAR|nr:unnamed protein product [Oppiella nova]CAG2170705.1 unnamed protein product [Oppiella nova]